MLGGERIARVGRRGKYLVIGFESGSDLLVHLRMTGSLRHAPDGLRDDDPYRRAIVELDDDSAARLPRCPTVRDLAAPRAW